MFITTTIPQPHLRPRLNQGYSHGDAIKYSHRDDWLLYCWSDTTLPSFLSSLGTFVADPTQKIQIGWRDQCATSKAISETLHERSTTVPGRLTSVKYSNPSGTIWLSIVLSDHRHKPLEQTLGTFHSLCIVEWRHNGVIGRAVGELLLAFWLCILTSFNCIMVIHTAPPRSAAIAPHSASTRRNTRGEKIAHWYIPHTIPE